MILLEQMEARIRELENFNIENVFVVEGAKAMLVRGTDTKGHWGADPVARNDFDPVCMSELENEWGRYKSGIGKI